MIAFIKCGEDVYIQNSLQIYVIQIKWLMFEEDPFCLCILQQNLGEKISVYNVSLSVYTSFFY